MLYMGGTLVHEGRQEERESAVPHCCPGCNAEMIVNEKCNYVYNCGRCEIVVIYKAERPPDSLGSWVESSPKQQPSDRPAPRGIAGSERKMQVLSGLSKGYSSFEIADAIGVTPETVKTFMKQIYKELEASNAAHAVHIAHQRGLIE